MLKSRMAQNQSALADRVALFKELSLFRDIPDADLTQLSARFIEYKLGRGEQLYEQGERAENFYIVVSGLLRCEQVAADERVVASALEEGDVFGARSLGLDGVELSRVKALHNCELLYLPRPDLLQLLARFPQVEDRLRTLAAGRSLKTELDLDWLGRDETVRFAARKHVAYLWTRIARAMVVAIAGLLAILFGTNAAGSATIWYAAGGGLLLLALGLTGWEILDWRNDYYIISDQRVVWLEQILLRSASRIEAPLESVQAVNTHTTLLGRLLGFGDISIRTYTGVVLMPSVADPINIKYLIEEFVARQRKTQRSARHDTIRQAVRESLGTAPQSPIRSSQLPVQMVDHTERFHMFKTRTIQGDKIIYHKHWFTLASNLALPAFFFVAVLFAVQLVYGGLPGSLAGWLIALVALAAPLGVGAYRYADWQNDTYMITPDSLLDTEKKPLGSLVTKTAPLANVLSLENHRIGLFGLLFNYGVVRINVGDASLDFNGVHDPARVQQDIFSRMEALKFKSEQSKADEERKRMTEWLKVYEEERSRAQRAGDSGRAVE